MGKGSLKRLARAGRYSPQNDCFLPPLGVEPRSAPCHRQEGEAAQEDGGGGAEQRYRGSGVHIPGWGPRQVRVPLLI